MAKTAHKPQMAAKEVPVLTREQMIADLRSLRAGKLFVGNMAFVDAVMEAYDETREEIFAMKQSLGDAGFLESALKAMHDAAERGVFTEITYGPVVPSSEVAGPTAEG